MDLVEQEEARCLKEQEEDDDFDVEADLAQAEYELGYEFD